jgi:hypothetical protein
MSHCGGRGWGVLMKKRVVVDYMYLAINTTRSLHLLITDIIKMKRAKHEKWICPY